MKFVSPFAYAQARMQARFGQRPGAAVWEGLHGFGELPAWLERARATPLRPWLASIGPATPAHEMERQLRDRLRETVDAAARWLPAEWRAAVRWTAVLADLPALAHLLRGAPAYDWMREEPALRELAIAEPVLRARVLAQGPWAALAHGDGATLFERWLEEWRRRWPRDGRHAALERLAALLREPHAPEPRLVQVFRRGLLAPAAVFAWLLLAALDAERVRGELLTRALFTPEPH